MNVRLQSVNFVTHIYYTESDTAILSAKQPKIRERKLHGIDCTILREPQLNQIGRKNTITLNGILNHVGNYIFGQAVEFVRRKVYTPIIVAWN